MTKQEFSLVVRLHNSLLFILFFLETKSIKENITSVQELDRWENNLLASVGP